MSDQHWNGRRIVRAHNPSRRRFIRRAGAAALGAGLAGTLAGCGGVGPTGPRTIRLGLVTPRTGPLASFAATDLFVVERMRESILADGISINGTSHPVEILVRDSQSSPTRAATVTSELILENNVDLVLVSSTPETTNPVSDQCETLGVPCISTMAPWAPWFFARGGDPATGFTYTWHFFWGQPDINQVFTSMWNQVETNRQVGFLLPNDADGNALADVEQGFPPALRDNGYEWSDPGRYQNGIDDFSAQIRRFRNDDCQIITGAPIPPDFTTFWRQAAQQGYRPRIATVAKAVLFPEAVEAVGELGNGLSIEIWWSPMHPYTSSLTGQSARDLADEWEEATGRQWTQPLGFGHALFEVAVDVLQRTQDIDSPESIAEAIGQTRMSTVVGNLDWSDGPIPNVAVTPLVGGQWRPGDRHRYDLTVVENSLAPEIPVGSQLEPIES